MKFILFVLAALGISAVQAQESAVVNNQLVVYGTATVDKSADRAIVTFTVKGFGPSIQTAAEVARKKVSDIADKLFAVGLKEENLHTAHFNSGDNFEGKAFLSSSRDFRALIESRVTIDSLELLEKVVNVLASGEVEQLSNINFALRNDMAVKLEARRLAVANAQEKAELMTGQLGVSVGRVLYVEELLSSADGDFYLPPRVSQANVSFYKLEMDGVRVTASGPSFFGQQFTVKSGVKVVFEITNNK
ncbi:MAG: SIMPL domain-containing protein [Ignavibacteriae bacterium]|nr:SIMPL domain-containing protein [Ignavibacteriota bacterium]